MNLHETHKQYFKLDQDGNTIWFPYSFWSKGYVLSETCEQTLKETLHSRKQILMALLSPVFIGLVFLVTWKLHLSRFIFFTSLLVPILAIATYGRIRVTYLTEDLEVSIMKMTFAEWINPELMRNYEGNFGFCVMGIILSLLGLCLSTLNLLSNGWWPSSLWIALFGLLGLLMFLGCRYLMRIRYNSKENLSK